MRIKVKVNQNGKMNRESLPSTEQEMRMRMRMRSVSKKKENKNKSIKCDMDMVDETLRSINGKLENVLHGICWCDEGK